MKASGSSQGSHLSISSEGVSTAQREPDGDGGDDDDDDGGGGDDDDDDDDDDDVCVCVCARARKHASARICNCVGLCGVVPGPQHKQGKGYEGQGSRKSVKAEYYIAFQHALEGIK